MMKAGHGWQGFGTGIAAEYLATQAGILHLNIAGWFIGAALTAGAALVPDLDHPPSTIARTFWILGRVRRLVLLLAWLTLFPTSGRLPQISHFQAMK